MIDPTQQRLKRWLAPAHFAAKIFAVIAVVFSSIQAHAGGDEVVVVYNSRLPESKQVAERYAAMRQVPKSQVFGFALTTNEVMQRADFIDFLQKPLAKKIEDAGLWKFSKISRPATNGQSARKELRLVESRIRYAVLCYGIPLKIDNAPINESKLEKEVPASLQWNGAAVDSELTWLPLIHESVPLTGLLPNPFYLCTNRTLICCTNGLLLVSRLDGPSAQIASNLVDKAMQAEKNGWWGRAYFDARGLATNDPYYLGDNWMMAAAAVTRLQGFDTLLDTNPETFRNWMPLDNIAIYAGWYDGEASGPFTLPRVEFMPGAFAYHLHSASANTLRSAEKFWCGPLLAKGATCTMGSVYEPYLPFTPNVAFFVQQLGNGFSFGEAAWTSQMGLSWQTAVVGDPLYQPMGMPLPQRHAQLLHATNSLIEWSFARLVNLDMVHGVRANNLATFLEGLPATKTSAVLTEKLADLYNNLGKPSSAIDTWQQAMKLNPTREQHIRLHNILAEKLLAAGRDAEAAENYRQLLMEYPDDPNAFTNRERLNLLEQKLPPTKK